MAVLGLLASLSACDDPPQAPEPQTDIEAERDDLADEVDKTREEADERVDEAQQRVPTGDADLKDAEE
ncbi:MAG: hypothetical protein ACOCV2_07055 [Persicimonas sp.]